MFHSGLPLLAVNLQYRLQGFQEVYIIQTHLI